MEEEGSVFHAYGYVHMVFLWSEAGFSWFCNPRLNTLIRSGWNEGMYRSPLNHFDVVCFKHGNAPTLVYNMVQGAVMEERHSAGAWFARLLRTYDVQSAMVPPPRMWLINTPPDAAQSIMALARVDLIMITRDCQRAALAALVGPHRINDGVVQTMLQETHVAALAVPDWIDLEVDDFDNTMVAHNLHYELDDLDDE